MTDAVLPPDASIASLSEAQRIVDVFVAPSKTFTDVLRKGSWWAPLLIMIIVSTSFAFTVQKRIGWETVYDNTMNSTPKVKEMLANLPADQQVIARQKGIARQPFTAYGAPIFALIFTAIVTLLVWPTINFGFGGTAKYGKLFAVSMYASLISYSARYILAIITVVAGMSPEGFNFSNPVGTNVGYFLAGGDSPLWLVTMGTFIDIFAIWGLVVTAIGCSIVGRVKRSSAMIVVFGWYIAFMILVTGAIAVFAS